MKTTIKRHGFGLHGFDPDKIICPDCKNSYDDLELLQLDYIDNKYRLIFICEECQCVFEIESDYLRSID